MGIVTAIKRMRMIDSFQNFLIGIGVPGRDRTLGQYYAYTVLDRTQLDNAYRGNWMVRKAIDIPPFDCTRQWRNWQADDAAIEKLEEAEKQWQVQRKLQVALTRARLYGGVAIVIGVFDGGNENAMDKPLEWDRVRAGDLKFLHVVSKEQLSTGERITDLLSPWFGEPAYYERSNFDIRTSSLPSGIIKIHPSRVIRLNGLDQPDDEATQTPWGDSVVQLIDDAIRNSGLVNSSIANMVSEAKVDVISVPDLTELMSTTEGTEALINRFSNSNSAKGVLNALLMDKDETLTTRQLSFTDLPDILQMFMLLVCGAVDIPATRFLGQSPIGMNATGESDIRNYYDRLKSDQSTRTTPAIRPLDEVIIRTTLGSRDKSIYYEWAPLWQMTEAEKAAIGKLKAEVVQIDVNTSLVPESALAKARQNQLIEDGWYPGLQTAIEESEASGEFSPQDPVAQVQKEAEQQAQLEVVNQNAPKLGNQNTPPPGVGSGA